eukprot:m.73069 g.73069  ORF g.73069 m.73069 type:complete len:63 (+) comp16116_c0_seq1:126-314(+)
MHSNQLFGTGSARCCERQPSGGSTFNVVVNEFYSSIVRMCLPENPNSDATAAAVTHQDCQHR